MRAFIAIAILLGAAASAEAAEWVRADLYFRGWLSERAAAISAEQLRDEARHRYSSAAHIASGPKLEHLIAVLDLPRLHAMRGDRRRDTYVVIDLFDSSGARATFCGDGHSIWSADFTRGREVDQGFESSLSVSRQGLTMRWSERRTAVRSTFEMTSTLPLRATRALVRRRSSCSR